MKQLMLVLVLLFGACRADEPTAPVAVRAPAVHAAVVMDQTPVPLAATIVGHKGSWKTVRLVWQDNARNENVTSAGYSDVNGRWMFSTQSIGGTADTGQRTTDLFAPKEAAFVQLSAMWLSQDVNVASDVTPYSVKLALPLK